MKKDRKLKEMDCYDKILANTSDMSQMYKVLNELARYPKKQEIQNCIVLLLGLMNTDRSIDLYHDRGKDREDLSSEEHEELIKICKSMFI
ncbi:MAG: hypothetical protein ACTSR8_04625 [Promethearchaeota archaeon]